MSGQSPVQDGQFAWCPALNDPPWISCFAFTEKVFFTLFPLAGGFDTVQSNGFQRGGRGGRGGFRRGDGGFNRRGGGPPGERGNRRGGRGGFSGPPRGGRGGFGQQQV